MSLLRYRYFLAVAEEMSFQKAADKLFISQQALSAHILKLEQAYGVTFFERKPKLSLTPAGEHMVLHCRRLIEEEHQMATDLSELSRSMSGKITVGIAHIRSRIFLSRIWELFHAVYPGVSLVIKETTNAQMAGRLLQNEIDLFIGVNTVHPAVFTTVPLVTEPLCCAVRREVLLENGVTDIDGILSGAREYFDLAAFLKQADLPYVMLPNENRIRSNINYFLSENGIVPNIAIECTGQSMAWEMCNKGAGITFFSPSLLYGSGFYREFDPDLLVFPVVEPSLITEIDIVYPASREVSGFFEAFIGCVRKEFAGYARMLDKIKLPPSRTAKTDG